MGAHLRTESLNHQPEGTPRSPGQFTSEVFYRFPLTQFLAVTPDAQLIVDPVFRPGHDVVAIACGVLSGTRVDGERVIIRSPGDMRRKTVVFRRVSRATGSRDN